MELIKFSIDIFFDGFQVLDPLALRAKRNTKELTNLAIGQLETKRKHPQQKPQLGSIEINGQYG